MKRRSEEIEIPSLEEVDTERKRIMRGVYYRQALSGTVSVLVVVAAVAVLVATLLLPIFQISGDSMAPALENNDIIVMRKSGSIDRGDIIGFYFQGKTLVKRVVALPGETVLIDGEGNVYVDGELLIEPYVSEKQLGECDLTFPYTVPVGSYFVLGDDRSSTNDSRTSVIGAISEEDVIGVTFFRAWPLIREKKANS